MPADFVKNKIEIGFSGLDLGGGLTREAFAVKGDSLWGRQGPINLLQAFIASSVARLDKAPPEHYSGQAHACGSPASIKEAARQNSALGAEQLSALGKC